MRSPAAPDAAGAPDPLRSRSRARATYADAGPPDAGLPEEATPGSVPAPPSAPPRRPLRWVRWQWTVALGLQTALTLFAAYSAWRAADVASRIAARPAPWGVAVSPTPTPAEPPAAGSERPAVRAPQIDILPGVTLGTASPALEGSAPEADFVAILVDGSAVGVAPVHNGRFVVKGLSLAPGTHEVVVIAVRRGSWTVESAPVVVRIAAQAATGPRLPRSPAARNILRGPARRHLALTFDGGSEAQSAATILDTLQAKSVHSTIFLTGDFIQKYPTLARRIARDGHEVGNHTLSHPHLADWVSDRGHVTRDEMNRGRLLEELTAASRLWLQTTGVPMSRFWRAPYGEVNREILAWAEEGGWVHVGWSEGLDTLDWVADRSDRRYRSAAQIRDRLVQAARAQERTQGGIVLMHLGGERTTDQPAEELPRIIDSLRGEGYRLVTISDLLGG